MSFLSQELQMIILWYLSLRIMVIHVIMLWELQTIILFSLRIMDNHYVLFRSKNYDYTHHIILLQKSRLYISCYFAPIIITIHIILFCPENNRHIILCYFALRIIEGLWLHILCYFVLRIMANRIVLFCSRNHNYTCHIISLQKLRPYILCFFAPIIITIHITLFFSKNHGYIILCCFVPRIMTTYVMLFCSKNYDYVRHVILFQELWLIILCRFVPRIMTNHIVLSCSDNYN